MKKYSIIYIISLLTFASSCKKFVEIGAPATSVSAENVFNNDINATSAVSYIYYDLMANNFSVAQSSNSIGALSAIAADELKTYTTGIYQLLIYRNQLLKDNTAVSNLWASAYKNIYRANTVLEGVAASAGISSATRNQLNGEAKFLRAFFYSYLVNLYGKVPLVLSSDYKQNATAARAAVADVYRQIVADLKEAQGLLTDGYLSGANTTTTSRIRPNKAAATALLARVYLYLGDWANAEAQASTIINAGPTYILEPSLTNVFKTTSKEAIWQLQPAATVPYTLDGVFYILTTTPTSGFFDRSNVLSTDLFNAFEAADNRKAAWVGSITVGANTYYFPGKYKSTTTATSLTENLMVLRLAEQFLIRAEARAMQGKLTGAGSAVEDVNAIRLRAGLGVTTLTAPVDIMTAIEKERRIELFTEWGHRWFDLKRMKSFTNASLTRADEVMPAAAAAKGGAWAAYCALWPIPLTEMASDPNLDQNSGYN